MKKIYLILLIFIISCNCIFAQISISTNLIAKTDSLEMKNKLYFGINSQATNYLDDSLGEVDFPGLPDPEGIIAYFSFPYDSTNTYTDYSFIDYKPIPKRKSDSVVYNLIVKRPAGEKLYFQWNTLSSFIDSARIVDAISEGNIIKINMKDSLSALVNDLLISKFKIFVWYSITTSAVNEYDINNSYQSIYPNPAKDIIEIKSDNIIDKIEIYSQLGIKLNHYTINDKKYSINIENLPIGVYLIKIIDVNNRESIKKFIKNIN